MLFPYIKCKGIAWEWIPSAYSILSSFRKERKESGFIVCLEQSQIWALVDPGALVENVLLLISKEIQLNHLCHLH